MFRGLVLCVLVAVAYYAGLNIATDPLSLTISLQNSTLLREVAQEYLSIGLDSYILHKKFCGLNFKKALPLVKALAPAYVRVGGTDAEQLIFDPSDPREEFSHPDSKDDECVLPWLQPRNATYKFTGSDWDRLYQFMTTAGIRIVFCLNVLLRTDEGNRWNASNAQLFLDYSAKRNYSFDLELGNEPNLFHKFFNKSVPPSHLARDFKTLKQLVQKYPLYKNALLVGPSATRPSASKLYIRDFLQHDTAGIVDRVTFHHYYFNGKVATVDNFIDPSIFDWLVYEITTVVDWVKKYGKPNNKPVWIGETACAYNGGAPNISNTYAAGFMWLDKLGLGAQLGLSVIVRQSIYFGYYALLDTDSFTPRPDYWLSLLYKQIVGTAVLSLSLTASDPSKEAYLRFYAACSRRNSQRAVIYGMNLLDESVQLDFKGPTDNAELFQFQPGTEDLTSRTIRLNGQTLEYDPGAGVPQLSGITVQLPITIPPKSYLLVELESEDMRRLCQ